MDKLKQNMISMYHSNLETHAKKNKIDIYIPKNKNINYDDNTFTPTLTEEPSTETNADDFIYKKRWNN